MTTAQKQTYQPRVNLEAPMIRQVSFYGSGYSSSDDHRRQCALANRLDSHGWAEYVQNLECPPETLNDDGEMVIKESRTYYRAEHIMIDDRDHQSLKDIGISMTVHNMYAAELPVTLSTTTMVMLGLAVAWSLGFFFVLAGVLL